MKCRYDCSGKWLKGNVHLHTTVSDGSQTPMEAARAYADEGYDFVAITDHNTPSRFSEEDGWPLIVLDGAELDGVENNVWYHVLCLGSFKDLPEGDGLFAKLNACKAQGGVVILAHPHLLMYRFEEALAYKFDGVEIYNALGELVNRNANQTYWDFMMLAENTDVLGFAVDDAHGCGKPPEGEPEYAYWKLGWIVVNCREATSASVFDAIRRGNFYSSTGPRFESIEITEDDRIVLHTSPIRNAWIVSRAWECRCKGMPPAGIFTEAEFPMQEWPYIRVGIEDESGRRAWSNNIFADQQ